MAALRWVNRHELRLDVADRRRRPHRDDGGRLDVRAIVPETTAPPPGVTGAGGAAALASRRARRAPASGHERREE